VNYAINVIKSLRWPGAVTVSKSGEYCNIYIGDGNKREGASYGPTHVPDVQDDPKEAVE
jgi:hypothetical protein